jgi:predicted AlkP superfamily phosphohydrolase/phosphomutase
VDRSLGEMLQYADEHTLVVLMSDHGFGPLEGFLHINNFLLNRGYLVLKSGAPSLTKRALFRVGVTPQNVHEALKILKLDFRRKLNRGRAYGLLRRFFLSFEDVDWNRTRAFALGHIGQIYVNLQGRQPAGIVRPGAEYDQVRDAIRKELVELRLPETGELLIDRVFNREEIYHGELLDELPDLVFLPRDFRYIAFGESEFASNQVVGPTLGHTGHHRLEGIVALSGEGVRPDANLHEPTLLDLAPTILLALGLPLPPDMDGRVLSEAFTWDLLSTPSFDSTTLPHTHSGVGYSEADESEVIRRLNDLGYVS